MATVLIGLLAYAGQLEAAPDYITWLVHKLTTYPEDAELCKSALNQFDTSFL